MIPDENTRIAMVKTGELDAIGVGIEGATELEKMGFTVGGLQSVSAMVCLFGSYQPECAGLPTADIRVRQALSLAINRNEIINTFFYGKGTFPIGPGLFPNMPEIDTDYWTKYAANIYRYDPEKAKQLLAEVGYPNGFSIKMWSWAQYSIDGPKLCEILQGYWLKIGVKAEIVPVDMSVWRAARTAPSLQLVGVAVPNSAGLQNAAARINLMNLFGSTSIMHLFYGRADVDKLLADALSEMDANKAKDKTANVEKICIDSYTDLEIANIPAMCAVGKRLDVKFSPSFIGVESLVEFAKHRKP